MLAVLIVRLWWVHDSLLVCWRYGRAAYVHQGIRVLPGKPARFSTGELVPQRMEAVVGLAWFLAITFVPSALLVFALRGYARLRRTSDGSRPRVFP